MSLALRRSAIKGTENKSSGITAKSQPTAEMKGLIFTICFIFCTLLDTGLAQGVTTAPLYRYWRASVSDHFYTTNPAEIGTTSPGQVGKYGYKSEGIQCNIYKYNVLGSVPLYRYWQGSVSDHFYTTNAGEIGTTTPGQTGKYGYKSEGIVGFCMPKQMTGTVPLYRYWKGSVSDHFYTTNVYEIGTVTPGQVGYHGYKSEGIQCYVLPV